MIKDTTEEQTPGSTPAPDWWSKTEEEKLEHTYWTCFGTDVVPQPHKWYQFRKKAEERTSFYRNIYHSKEEAEAHASIIRKAWVWDKNPARPITIASTMAIVRQEGELGVRIIGFQDGKWRALKTYLSGEPLPKKYQSPTD
jgi:hypothetical protein